MGRGEGNFKTAVANQLLPPRADPVSTVKNREGRKTESHNWSDSVVYCLQNCRIRTVKKRQVCVNMSPRIWSLRKGKTKLKHSIGMYKEF